MTKLPLLLAPAVISLLCGIAFIVKEWTSLPNALAPTLPAWASRQTVSTQADAEKVKGLVQTSRTAVLNQDEKPLLDLAKGSHGDVFLAEVAKAFGDSKDTHEQVARFCGLVREEPSGRLFEVYAGLHKKHELCMILRPAEDKADEQRLVRLREVADKSLEEFKDLKEPFGGLLIWRAIAQVALKYGKVDVGKRDFDSRQLEECETLCSEALNHPNGLCENDRIILRESRLQAEEQLEWHYASSPPVDGNAIERIQAYISKYRSKLAEHPEWKPHLDKAESLYGELDWAQTVKILPPQIVREIGCPGRQAEKAAAEIDINLVALDRIHELNAFCGRHAFDSVPAHRACARKAAALLLRAIIEKNSILTPGPVDLKEIEVRRDGAKFVGIVINEETNERVVTMRDPSNKEFRWFFQDALLRAPALTNDSRKELEYKEVYDRVIKQLLNFDWAAQPMQDLVNTSKDCGFEQRVKLVEPLATLVNICEEFRKL